MSSEFQQLADKVSQLARLAQGLRDENAELRRNVKTLADQNAELNLRVDQAHDRVAAILATLPVAEVAETDTASEEQETA
jgi:regulator of replication initiation timing